MAGSLNKVQIIGNLGRDPEVRSMNNGNRVVTLSVATSETWNDKASGERKERTEWHRVVIWNDALGTVAEKYLTKGRKVYLEGQLQTRKYTDKDGEEKYTTEIVLQNFRGELTILDSRQDSDDDRGSSRGGRDDRGGGRGGRDDRGSSRGGRDDDRGGGRDDRRASSNGRDAPRDDDRRGSTTARAPATQSYNDLDDEIPF